MTQRRIFKRKTTIVAAAGLIAGMSLAMTVRADRDDRGRDLREAIDRGRARNVIMFLGDGMGDSEITVARNYPVGSVTRT
jgi:alkaline phosphatase